MCQGQARGQTQIKIILGASKSKSQPERESSEGRMKLGKERPLGTFQETRMVSVSAVYIGMVCWCVSKEQAELR